MELDAALPGRADALLHQVVARDGGEVAGEVELVDIAGVRARALGEDEVHDVDVVLQGPGRADADDVLHIVGRVQLPAVDADGRHAHAGGHHAHRHVLPFAGVALYAAHVVDEHGVGQEILGDVLRAQGVAGHEDGLGKGSGSGAVMRGHTYSSLSFLQNDTKYIR